MVQKCLMLNENYDSKLLEDYFSMRYRLLGDHEAPD